MKSVLVLCEGNICRSPMAAALLAAGLPDVRVRSSGLGALVGSPADPHAVQLMAERGLDITAHRAEQITRQQCESSDLVLTMSTSQRDAVLALYPQVRGRVYRLGEYAKCDIPDPYREDLQYFRYVFDLIDKAADDWLGRIRQL